MRGGGRQKLRGGNSDLSLCLRIVPPEVGVPPDSPSGQCPPGGQCAHGGQQVWGLGWLPVLTVCYCYH